MALRFYRVASALAAIVTWGVGGPTQAQVVTFSQVDYYQDGSLAVPDSEWGEFDIAYNQSGNLQWINVVADPGTANARWIVQNHPLLPTTLTGTSQFTSDSYFDLGVPRGTPVSTLNIGYSITSAPEKFAPTTFGTLGSFGVGESQNIINNGVPSGNTTLGAPSNGNFNWNVPFTGVNITWHRGMPNVVQEKNWCGPGAAANSLQWLNSQNNLGLTQTLKDTQSELAGRMGNDHHGNWDDTEVLGKEEFISDHKLPLEVHYAGGRMLPKNTPLTWDWIESEMAKGQDIEIMTDTHWVVVEGTLSFGDIHLISFRDDPFQNGDMTTGDEKATIDKRHTWTYFKDGLTDIGNGEEVHQTAVAESPVPEPSGVAFVLIASGSIGVLIGHRRRRN